MGDAPADGMVLKVGGVPEHFNAPWHLTIGEMKAAGEGPAVEWTTVHGGTGAMASMLKSGELDAAMMLTEGAVAAITKEGGEGLRIWGQYVASPLTWGIHTGSKNAGRFKTADDLKGSVIAISRFGSGSHLMAYVDAQQRGWDTSALKFEVVGSLEGSRKALAEGGSAGDVWLWEKFTTKHLVDSGEFLRVGEVATPWPCFCICVSEAARKDAAKMSALNDVLAKVRAQAEKFKQNEAGATIDHLMSEYKMLREDAEEWLGGVHWAVANKMDAGVLSTVKKTLLGLEIIQEDLADEKLVTEGCTISTK